MVQEILWEILRFLKRKKIRIDFNALSTAKPVSPIFGFDRGTPIDRYYIEKFLAGQGELIKGRVLEIGDSHYSRRFGGGRVEAYEVLHATSDNKAATIIGDLCDIDTLPENSIDCFICTQTFNFIFDVQKALQGAHHLLKPGGVLLATVSGISQISRYDMERWGDYWRFTTASLQRLIEPFFKGGVRVASFGNVMAACAFLQGVAIEDLPDRGLLDENDPDYQLLLTVVARKGP
jgi:SAM-dependent methyltransferase